MGIDACILLRLDRHLAAKVFQGREARLLPAAPDAVRYLTLARFEDLRADRALAAEAASGALPGSPELHDDPRGMLVFPDVCEPTGRSYDDIARELEPAGFWVQPKAFTNSELLSRTSALFSQLSAMSSAAPPGSDQAQLGNKLSGAMQILEAMQVLEAHRAGKSEIDAIDATLADREWPQEVRDLLARMRSGEKVWKLR